MHLIPELTSMWGTVFCLVLFMILFESRYPRRKTLILTLSTMIPLILVNCVLLVLLGTQAMGTLVLLTCSLPSLIFFWFLAKRRDGRFLFTFCLADTIVLEVLCITSVLDFFLGNTYLFMLVSRLIAYPLLAWFTYRWVRPIYLEVQAKVEKGWYVFAAISLIFYFSLALTMSHPTMITQRLEALPAFLLLLILMPVLYVHIFTTLRRQQKLHELTEQDNILRMQVANMTTRIEEFSAAGEKTRMERHNLRHRMQTIASLAEKQQYQELLDYVAEYHEALRETEVKRYCTNPILDAVLSAYLQQAERKGIQVKTSISLPDPLPVNDAELATVFANALENAICACEALPVSQRWLTVRVLTVPQFMLQISNTFNGQVEFDAQGVPVSHQDGHGFGTRSIVAFCEKNGAYYEFKATEDTFALRISF